MNEASTAAVSIDFDFLGQVERSSGIAAGLCYQCRKCSNGCPLTFAMDHPPDRILRFLLLGQAEAALRSRTIWVCSSCETCTTRCPNGIDIAGLMDHLKEEACRRGLADPNSRRSLAMHRAFLAQIRRRGRVHEGSLMNAYLLKSGAWWSKIITGELSDDLRLGWALWKRGRLPLWPQRVSDRAAIRSLFADSDL